VAVLTTHHPQASPDVVDGSQPRSGRRGVQVHLWLRASDAADLKELALERDQTVSSMVRTILRFYRRATGVVNKRT